MIKWLSVKPERNTVEHEDVKEEFFADSELKSEVISLARESIQNSIDAKLENNLPVKMRFTVASQKTLINEKYFADLQSHLNKTFGHQNAEIKKESNFLVIEDFNTSGLEGSIKSAKVENQEFIEKYGNSFWYFEWATGQSPKTAGGRGSWGVGKIVFAASSAIKTYLVFSCRREEKSPETGTQNIVFGHSIQKYANINGERIKPERMWMQVDSEGSFIPYSEKNIINDLKTDWRVTRNPGETGTSIIVPFIKDELTISDLKICIMQDYFIAILDGTLTCELEDPTGNIIFITKDNLIDEIEKLSEAEISGSLQSKNDLIEHCKLYIDRIEGKTILHEFHQIENGNNNWDDVVEESDDWHKVRQNLDSGFTVELRISVNVPIKFKPNESTSSSFTVLIKRAIDVGLSKTVFSRQGILISKANPESKLRDYYSMIVTESTENDRVLAQFLSDSEGPAHKEWTQNTDRFKKRYLPNSFANNLLRFIKNSIIQIGRFIQPTEEVIDDRSLSNFFPDSNRDGMITNNRESRSEKNGHLPGNEGGGGSGVARSSRKLTISPTQDGFIVKAGSSFKVGEKFEIEVAYAVRNGSSFGEGSRNDFALENHYSAVLSKGLKVIDFHANTVKFEFLDKDSVIVFEKFDLIRDISISEKVMH